MPTNLAINGFGRMGRLVLRTLMERYKTDLAVVAVNDMADLKTNAHLFRTTPPTEFFRGRSKRATRQCLSTGKNRRIQPKRALPFALAGVGVDIVIEATGVFTDAAQVRAHLTRARKKRSSPLLQPTKTYGGPRRQS